MVGVIKAPTDIQVLIGSTCDHGPERVGEGQGREDVDVRQQGWNWPRRHCCLGLLAIKVWEATTRDWDALDAEVPKRRISSGTLRGGAAQSACFLGKWDVGRQIPSCTPEVSLFLPGLGMKPRARQVWPRATPAALRVLMWALWLDLGIKLIPSWYQGLA